MFDLLVIMQIKDAAIHFHSFLEVTSISDDTFPLRGLIQVPEMQKFELKKLI